MSQTISMLHVSQQLRSRHKMVCGSLIDLSDTFCLHFASTRWGKKAVTNNWSGGRKKTVSASQQRKSTLCKSQEWDIQLSSSGSMSSFFFETSKKRRKTAIMLCVRRPAHQLSPSTLYVGANQVSDYVITMTFS